MQRYILRRLFAGIPILFGVSLITFSILHLMPGDPVTTLVSGFDTGGTAELMDQLRAEYGLDRSLPVQFGSFVWEALQGDLGTSITRNRDVMEEILRVLPHTMQLAAVALVIAVVLGVTLGVIAATNHRRWPDTASIFVSLVGVSMPEFWFAILAVLLLAVTFPIFPTSGTGGIRFLILPALVLGTRAAAAIARLTRSSMLEVLNSQYIVTAEAKGMTRAVVVGRHALRNAVIPVVTLIGLLVGRLLGATVVVETIFNRQGIGNLVVDSILQKDIPMLQGSILVVSVTYVLLNILVDISYGWLDPRIRYS